MADRLSRCPVVVHRQVPHAFMPVVALCAVALASCRDTPPLGPRQVVSHAAYLASAITCRYAGGGTLPCIEERHAKGPTLAQALAELRAAPATDGASGRQVATRDVLFGSQGVNVSLDITGVTYSGGLLALNLAVQDLTTEPMGTADGRTPASDSIIVFFQQMPVVTQGSGAVTVNAPKTGTFTAANQPYFEYPGLLPSNASTIPLVWQFSVPSTVAHFYFTVYVTAQVPDTSAAALAIPAHVFQALAVGAAHTCAVRPTNHSYCWGFNEYGAAGIGASGPVATPVGTLGALAIQSASAGSEFSCGLDAGNGAWCWGDNLSGELGDGTTNDRGEPIAVAGGQSFTQLVTGNEFTCGLSNKMAYCWGDNYMGQLGDGTTNAHATPNAVSGSLQFVQLAAGDFHTCGLTAGGSVYCWGSNASGELGIGSVVSHAAPTLVTGGNQYAAVTAGNELTCALTTGGAAYCWGANLYGAIGNGTTNTVVMSPTAVGGGIVFSGIAAGAFHVCAVSAAGPTYCWGDNSNGQIGDGTTIDRTSPAKVSGSALFAAVGAGFAHTCALTAAGATYCWGLNTSGQLGNGTLLSQLAPAAVSLP